MKKECALAHSRAEARLLRQPSTLAPSAHPRGAFLSYRNEVSYTIKKAAAGATTSQFSTTECSADRTFCCFFFFSLDQKLNPYFVFKA